MQLGKKTTLALPFANNSQKSENPKIWKNFDFMVKNVGQFSSYGVYG
jgi:hypothetical protein